MFLILNDFFELTFSRILVKKLLAADYFSKSLKILLTKRSSEKMNSQNLRSGFSYFDFSLFSKLSEDFQKLFSKGIWGANQRARTALSHRWVTHYLLHVDTVGKKLEKVQRIISRWIFVCLAEAGELFASSDRLRKILLCLKILWRGFLTPG